MKPPPKEALGFTGALPPKVVPQPRNGVYHSAAASRRVTESDDEFSDGLRGGMRCGAATLLQQTFTSTIEMLVRALPVSILVGGLCC